MPRSELPAPASALAASRFRRSPTLIGSSSPASALSIAISRSSRNSSECS